MKNKKLYKQSNVIIALNLINHPHRQSLDLYFHTGQDPFRAKYILKGNQYFLSIHYVLVPSGI